MPQKFYAYSPETKEYLYEKDAQLSPLDKKQGRDVYLIPGYATTIAPPNESEGYLRVWTGQQWEQKKLHKLEKVVTVPLTASKFTSEIKATFPSINITIEGEIGGANSRSLIFHNLPDTPENNAALDALIAAHEVLGSKIEHISPAELVAFRVLCEEIKKMDAAFPDFETFKQKVNAALKQ